MYKLCFHLKSLSLLKHLSKTKIKDNCPPNGLSYVFFHTYIYIIFMRIVEFSFLFCLETKFIILIKNIQNKNFVKKNLQV